MKFSLISYELVSAALFFFISFFNPKTGQKLRADLRSGEQLTSVSFLL